MFDGEVVHLAFCQGPSIKPRSFETRGRRVSNVFDLMQKLTPLRKSGREISSLRWRKPPALDGGWRR
jgi:hypothetical protein